MVTGTESQDMATCAALEPVSVKRQQDVVFSSLLIYAKVLIKE